MLRIMAGEARGRILRTPTKAPLLRPILARVKKSVFDIIRPRLSGARFLDLFAGSGAVGLEAISRGAAHADFVEQDGPSARLIRENLEMLGFQNRGAVYRVDANQGLAALPGGYDIIFMGPPYKDVEKRMLALVHPTLDAIARLKLLKSGGLIVAQHHKKEDVHDDPHWTLARREYYGDTVVTFFRPAEAAS